MMMRAVIVLAAMIMRSLFFSHFQISPLKPEAKSRDKRNGAGIVARSAREIRRAADIAPPGNTDIRCELPLDLIAQARAGLR